MADGPEEKEQLVSANAPKEAAGKIFDVEPGNNAQASQAYSSHHRTLTDFTKMNPQHKQSILDGSYDEELNAALDDAQGFRRCLSVTTWCSCTWTLLAMLSLVMMIVFAAVDESDNGTYKLLLLPVMVAWTVYNVEWYFYSPISDYLQQVRNKDAAQQRLGELVECKAEIVWRSQAFHYESQAGTHTVTDRKITHTATQTYGDSVHVYCVDKSAECKLDSNDRFSLIKLKIYTTFEFADKETQQDYERKFDAFCEENNKDEYQSIAVVIKLKDEFLSNVLVDTTHTGDQHSKWWSLRSYHIMSCLCCSSCYRMHFNAVSRHQTHILQKQITIKDL